MGDGMKLLLVSGIMQQIVVGYLTKNADIINSAPLEVKDLLTFLEDVNPTLDGLLFTDEAFSRQEEQDKQDFIAVLNWLNKGHRQGVKIIVISRDFAKEGQFAELSQKYTSLRIFICDYVRVPRSFFEQTLEVLRKENGQSTADSENGERTEEPEKKLRSWLINRFSKPQNKTEIKITDGLTRELENISRGISRVIAITGHRGCGLTSTVANIAYEASKRGLNSLMIDLDVEYRSINMYYGSFGEQAKRDEVIEASLIRTLARPQDYLKTAFNIKENLWMTALGYGFNDRKLLGQFYNCRKLVGLVSVLRNKFNLIILDMPMDLLPTFKEAIIHVDVFGLCVPNNLYAVLSTLRNIEVMLDKESASYLNAKSRLIVTKYNDRSRFKENIFIPEKVNELLTSGLNESFTYEMKLAGHVPFSSKFDAQIETDIPLVNTSVEHEQAYGNILLRLMEGIN